MRVQQAVKTGESKENKLIKKDQTKNKWRDRHLKKERNKEWEREKEGQYPKPAEVQKRKKRT